MSNFSRPFQQYITRPLILENKVTTRKRKKIHNHLASAYQARQKN
jgi:hypothetical protein